MRPAFTHSALSGAMASVCAGYAISKWLVQTRLSSRGGDWSTLTPLQAQRLREMLTDLGPAFVKIGQVREGNVACGRQLLGADHSMRP